MKPYPIPLHSTLIRPQSPVRRSPTISGMAGNIPESYTFRSVDPELVLRGLDEEMVVCLVLHRSREESA